MTIPRLVVRIVLALPACFAIWYWGTRILLAPVHFLAWIAAVVGFGDLFADVDWQGFVFTFVTRIPQAMLPGRAGTGFVAFDVDPLVYTWGSPLFAALTLAAWQPGLVARLTVGLAALIPFQTWGVLADAVKTVAFNLGPEAAARAGFSPLQREVVVFAFQFGSLILPAVAPAVVWLLLHRAFLARLAGLGAR